MKFSRSITCFCLAVEIALCARDQNKTVATSSSSGFQNGLVVEEVSKSSQAQRVGVHPGDILLSWRGNGVSGEFQSPFDLTYVFFDQASRGPVRISGLRGREHRNWLLGSDTWGISIRPNFSDPLLAKYLQAEELLSAGKFPEAAEHFRMAAALPETSHAPWLASWLLSRAGKALLPQRQDLSDALYDEAIAEAPDSPPLLKAELLRQRAAIFAERQDLSAAAKYYSDVLLECEKLGRKTIFEGNVLLSLGIIELQRGAYDAAEEHLRRSMAIGETLAPASIQNIVSTVNLAVLYQDQGQLDKAEQYYLKALDKEDRSFPHSARLEGTLNDLGVLFDQEGDLARAEAYHLRALAVAESLDPNSLDVADILANLAECFLERGHVSRAESYEKRALLIRERAAPESLATAYSLAGLGKVARMRGELTKAEGFYRRALAIAALTDAPGHDKAKFLLGLAAVLRENREFSKAEQLYRRALGIIEREDPGSIDRTTALGDLAGTLYQEKRLDEAAELYREALTNLENRSLHLHAADEARSRYRAEHVRYYQEYMQLLIEHGQPELAFEVLEGARGRTLLEMLARARVNIEQGADPALRERERRLSWHLSAKTEYRLRVAGGMHTDQQLMVVDKQIEELLLQYQQVQAELRVSSPAYAAITQPQKFGLKDLQKLLDPNTLLLEYSLAEERSYLWIVSDQSLNVVTLPKRTQIEIAARRVYRLLTPRNPASDAPGQNEDASRDQYLQAAKRLSDMVIGPVAKLLRAKRLVIVSDGALQYIPFSALPRPGERADAVPLIVDHEIINLPSASMLAELRRQEIGRPEAPKTVAILADPVFDATDERFGAGALNRPTSPGALPRTDLLRSVEDLGLTRSGGSYLGRLLYTRKEAEAVMAVTPAGQGMMALDFEANRRIASSPALANYRIVHFATHGILDNKHPELSGLVLSLVNKKGKPQDGFLKLQDIYNLRLPVELVVLSGCQTGLGEQIKGEGLIGLTRGFMYAGASRVVASLWSVSDSATATLMAKFYEAMEREGMRPAAALRTAQIQMWQEKQWSFPYYWAAFQIQGDWR